MHRAIHLGTVQESQFLVGDRPDVECPARPPKHLSDHRQWGPGANSIGVDIAIVDIIRYLMTYW